MYFPGLENFWYDAESSSRFLDINNGVDRGQPRDALIYVYILLFEFGQSRVHNFNYIKNFVWKVINTYVLYLFTSYKYDKGRRGAESVIANATVVS